MIKTGIQAIYADQDFVLNIHLGFDQSSSGRAKAGCGEICG